jgi:hypothetical protein
LKEKGVGVVVGDAVAAAARVVREEKLGGGEEGEDARGAGNGV